MATPTESAYSFESQRTFDVAVRQKSRWQTLDCTGRIPIGRIGHTLCTNDEQNKVFLYGGVNDANEHTSQYLDDFYVLDYHARVWTKVELTGQVQCPRAFHTTVYHKGLMYVFGGCNGRGRFNRLFTIDETGVCVVVHTDPPPSTRYCHSAVLYEDNMYVFAGKCGGRNSNKRLKDLHRYSIADSKWLVCEQFGDMPTARSAHAAFTCGRHMMILGGRNEKGDCCEDAFLYNYGSGCWRAIETQHASLFGRARHSVVEYNGKVIIFGGWNGKKKLNDLFVYHIDASTVDTMHELDEGCPSRRECHVAVVCLDTMIVFGGRFRGTFMNDVCCFKIEGKSLKEMCRDLLIKRGVPIDAMVCSGTGEAVPDRVQQFVIRWRDITETKVLESDDDLAHVNTPPDAILGVSSGSSVAGL